jgi:rhodanese-related sulfurtransferase
MMTKTGRLIQLCAVFALHIGIVSTADAQVMITPDLDGLTVEHQGRPVRVQREQNETQVIEPNFQRASREMPAFLRSAEEPDIADILERQFDARRRTELWNFRDAKTLVMFCNGAWCGQSPANIGSLTRMGYPPSKIKWYRGGMQAWETLGLATVVAESQ